MHAASQRIMCPVRSSAGRARGKRVVAALEEDSDNGEDAAQAAPSPAQVSTASSSIKACQTCLRS